MNRITVNLLFLLLLTISSCSNEFLYQKNERPVIGSVIYIFPDRPTVAYTIRHSQCAGNHYVLKSKPEWLTVDNPEGEFAGDRIELQCSAVKFKAYSEPSLYNDIIVLDIENVGECAQPVAYVNEGKPVISVPSEVHINYDSYLYNNILIENVGKGILFWSLAEYPEWVDVLDLTSGIITSGGKASLNVRMLDNYLARDTSGVIKIRCGAAPDTSSVEIALDYKAPVPRFVCNTSDMDFGDAFSEQKLVLLNQGTGDLKWEVKNMPKWLGISKGSGSIAPYSAIDLVLKCYRDSMPAGYNSVDLAISTNDPQLLVHTVSVRAMNRGRTGDAVRAIEGNITDACYDRSGDMLYLSVAQPNGIVAYDMNLRRIDRQLALPHAPTCMKIDGDRAVVGHGGYISLVDIKDFSVIRTIEVDVNVYDLEWGALDWICYTASGVSGGNRMRWINMRTGQMWNSGEYGLGDRTVVKKVPGIYRQYIIASTLSVSPSGIRVYDAVTMEQVMYYHQSIDKFWFSSDGALLFDSWKNIYRVSSLLGSGKEGSVFPVNTFQYEDMYNVVGFVDYNPDVRRILVMPRLYVFTPRHAPDTVLELEADDYTVVNRYEYDGYYFTTVNGREDLYEVKGHYVFCNRAGTQMVVIKDLVEDGVHGWLLEFIPLRNS